MPDNLPTILEDDSEGLAEREYLNEEQAKFGGGGGAGGSSAKSEGFIFNMQPSLNWQLKNFDLEWKSEQKEC